MQIESREYLDKIVCEIINGLTTDGVHHKQYYLEKIFRMFCEDSYVDKTYREFQWEDGIAP
jgi:hypothetical protein